MATWTCQLMLGLALFCFAAPLLVRNGASAHSVRSPKVEDQNIQTIRAEAGADSIADAIKSIMETEEGRMAVEGLFQFTRYACAMQKAGEDFITDVIHHAPIPEEGKEALTAMIKLMTNIINPMEGLGEDLIADALNYAERFFEFMINPIQGAGELLIADFIKFAPIPEEGKEALMAFFEFMTNPIQDAGEQLITNFIQFAPIPEEGKEALIAMVKFMMNLNPLKQIGKHPFAVAIDYAKNYIQFVSNVMQETGERLIADVIQHAPIPEEDKEAVMAMIMKNIQAMKEAGNPISYAINNAKQFIQFMKKVCELQEAAGEQPTADVIDRALETVEGRQTLMAVIAFVKNIHAMKVAAELPIYAALYRAKQFIQFIKDVGTMQGAAVQQIANAAHGGLQTEEGREDLMA
ncbi:uncharacterized protein LOC143288842 [Babylonia areolata]|uniref:uncharacterized protein LOC143288842 n=1 Tax=Babylonia areolata TaxID=304850 RepID=UPI003FD0FCBF